MLQLLVESRAVRERSASWAGVSIVLHSALIGLALYLTGTMEGTIAPTERIETLVYTAPAPAPAQATPATVAAAVPIAISRLSFTVPQMSLPSVELPASDIVSRVIADLSRSTTGLPIGTLVGAAPAGGIYTAGTVDRIVAALAGNASPAYPTRLSNAGVEGEVLARFVVDTTGRVETESIVILQASHGLFGDAVKQWLRQNRYSPALVSGRAVRQLVQQRIGFTLTR